MKRRGEPRIWNADWLVLRPLALLISAQVKLHTHPPALLLDFGCGDMPYKAMLERLGVQYVGADLNEGADLVIDNNGQVPLRTGTVNAVLSSQVLEHVSDVGTYLSEIRRVLSNDGVLYLSTHGTWLYHPHPGDYHRWTRVGLIVELERHGFDVDEAFSIAGPLATTTLVRLTGYAFVMRKIPIFGKIIAGILSVIMNVRAIMEDFITPGSVIENDACVYFVRAHPKAP